MIIFPVHTLFWIAVTSVTLALKTEPKEAPSSNNSFRDNNTYRSIYTTFGPVRGIKINSDTGTNFWKYQNIPYAEPPVGKRRFKDPEPLKDFFRFVDGSKNENKECIQLRHHFDKATYEVVGQEDCLYLTVYVPERSKGNIWLLPVIVYLHGGTFMYGSLHSFDPMEFLEQNVVFVKLNFRLGPFGFLSTGNDIVPGNMGLKDQILALQWVKKYILAFGGDPQKVTIAGSYAGAASVHFHMFSKESKGLFHRAISNSGTMLSPWALAEKLPEKTTLMAKHANCPTDDMNNTIDCLRNKSAQEILVAVDSAMSDHHNNTPVVLLLSPWAPVVDNFASKPLIPEYPAIQMYENNVTSFDWLVGVSDAYGFNMGSDLITNTHIDKHVPNEWPTLAPKILDCENTMDEVCKKYYLNHIRHVYMKDSFCPKEQAAYPLCNDYYSCDAFCQMIADRLFYVDTERAVRWMSKLTSSRVYLYNERSAPHSVPFTNSLFNNQSYAGFRLLRNHLDNNLNSPQFSNSPYRTPEVKKKVAILNAAWVSFALTGKPQIPNIQWLVVMPENLQFVEISNNGTPEFKKNVEEIGKQSFWNDIPFKEYNRYPDPHLVPIHIEGEDQFTAATNLSVPDEVTFFKRITHWQTQRSTTDISLG